MKCIYCNSKTQVLETRINQQGLVRRRRSCPKCHTRYTTTEKIEVIDAYKEKGNSNEK